MTSTDLSSASAPKEWFTLRERLRALDAAAPAPSDGLDEEIPVVHRAARPGIVVRIRVKKVWARPRDGAAHVSQSNAIERLRDRFYSFVCQ